MVASGIKELQYSLNDGATWTKYENPVKLNPGPNNIKAKAIDNVGNESEIAESTINYDALEMTLDDTLINFGDTTGLEVEKMLNFTVSSSSNYGITIFSKDDLISDNRIVPINKIQASVDSEEYNRIDKDKIIPLVDNVIWGVNNRHILKLKIDPLYGYISGNYTCSLTIKATQN